MRKWMIVAALAAFTSPAFAADTFVVDKTHGEVGFQVTHLGLSKVKGWFGDYDGTIVVDAAKPEASSVEFTIKVASVNTNNEGRDKDLREGEGFFEAAKFPTITFKSTKVVPKGKDAFDVTGTFTLHGVSKTITLPIKVAGPINDPWGNVKYGFDTQTVVNRKDYGITWSKPLDNGGLVVGDEVTVTISLEAAKKKDAAAK
jgi:polyisoprenoid-binding protein YceI